MFKLNLAGSTGLTLDRLFNDVLETGIVTKFATRSNITHALLPTTKPADNPHMRTELFTVSRIFTESLYRIPDYQRGYSWGDDQLADFWLDIEQLEGDNKHYTGVLTLEEVPETTWSKWASDTWIIRSRRYKPYYIVDGQQRLTTVVLLITAILELGRPAHLNYTSRDDVRRKYIFDSKPEEIARSYIFGYEKDNPSYEFLKKRIFLEESEIHSPDEQTIYTKNLIAAKEFFVEKIKELKDSDVERLFTKITQQFVLNVYEISSDIDVFVTFETMNNRGKLLSTLELLKNRLIFLSSKLPPSENGGQALRQNINEAWKAAYHFLGKNDARQLNDDLFLRTHIAYFYLKYLGKIPDHGHDDYDRSRRRYGSAIEHFGRFLLNLLFTPKRLGLKPAKRDDLPPLTREFLNEYSQELKSSVELYFKLSTPTESSFPEKEKIWLERIGRLLGHNPSEMLLAVYKGEKKSEKRIALLECLERYSFLASLGPRGPLAYSRRFWGPDYFIKYVSGKMTIDEVISQIGNLSADLLRETSLSETIRDWAKGNSGYYGWKTIKYFLFEYEQSLQDSSRSSREKIDWAVFCKEDYENEYETIEHIYPQRARDKYWTDRFSSYNPTEKRLLRNSLGNLLALARPRNSSLGNKSFPEKLGNEAAKVGYRYGSYSENEVALRPDWDADEILIRGLKLLDFMEQRWKLSIGDQDQKTRALGLSFLKR